MNFQIFPQQFKLKIIHKSNHPLCYIKRKMILNKKKLYINCVFDSNVIYEIQCCGSQITWIAYKWHIQINFEFLCKKKYIKDKYNCLRAISKTIVWVASQVFSNFPHKTCGESTKKVHSVFPHTIFSGRTLIYR